MLCNAVACRLDRLHFLHDSQQLSMVPVGFSTSRERFRITPTHLGSKRSKRAVFRPANTGSIFSKQIIETFPRLVVLALLGVDVVFALDSVASKLAAVPWRNRFGKETCGFFDALLHQRSQENYFFDLLCLCSSSNLINLQKSDKA